MHGLMATTAAAVLAGALGLAACATGAGQADNGRSCFYARNVNSWTAVDRTTVNIRVGVNDDYQLILQGDCPNIDWTHGIGLEHRGASWICSGLDATLIVPQQTQVPPMRCPVTSIRKLSPAEVAALPPKDKP
jgi:hypothetical protein